MNRFLLFVTIVFITTQLKAQFIPGNLAVLRYGDGTAALSNTTVPLFIDEYNLTGSLISTLEIPKTTTGSNFRIVGLPKSSAVATNYTTENSMTLSQGGDYLSVFGYDQSVGATSLTGVGRVIGRIDSDKSINSSTRLTSSSTPRSALCNNDGNSFFYNISNDGISRINLGATTSIDIEAATATASVRNFHIFCHVLYATIGSSNIRQFEPIPAIASTSTNINLPGSASQEMFILDTDGDGNPDIIYIADDGNPSSDVSNASIRKFKLVSGAWVAQGTIKIAGTTDGLKSITGKVNGSNVELYAVTWGNLATTPNVSSKILKITDLGALGSNISTITPTILASAPANTKFHSIKFTPGTDVTPYYVLPVKLTSFSVKDVQNYAELKWVTSSETNSSHFEVLRSQNGVDFNTIGQIKSVGKSNAINTYFFNDKLPFIGTNYYQLKQVDFDGKEEKYDVISFKNKIDRSSISAYFTNDDLNLNIFSNHSNVTYIELYDVQGNKVLYSKTYLNPELNSLVFPLKSMANGVYVLNLVINQELKTIKLLKF